MAIIVTVLGLILTLPFQIFIREKPSVALKKLKWYKWLIQPKFYLVIIKSALAIDIYEKKSGVVTIMWSGGGGVVS